jgi:hypothetical protein
VCYRGIFDLLLSLLLDGVIVEDSASRRVPTGRDGREPIGRGMRPVREGAGCVIQFPQGDVPSRSNGGSASKLRVKSFIGTDH